MAGPTLNVAEIAAELGRSEAWLYENWRAEVAARRLPAPLNGGRAPLTWSRAQVYAMQDRDLTPTQRAAAMAYRAAAAAAAGAPHVAQQQLEDAAWRQRLDERFGGT